MPVKFRSWQPDALIPPFIVFNKSINDQNLLLTSRKLQYPYSQLIAMLGIISEAYNTPHLHTIYM